MITLFSNFRRSGPAAFVAALAVPFAWLMLAPVPAAAAPGTSEWIKTEQTELRLIAATETAGAAETLRFGLHFKLKPGWKIYWRSPGDAGFPPVIDWSPSRNLKSAVMHWPAPERFSVLGLETLGYKKEVVFPLTVTRADPSRPLELAGTLRYLVCDEICIPYDAEIALSVAQGPIRPSKFAHLISRFQSNVPGDGKRQGLAVEAVETWGRGKAAILRVRATSTTPFKTPDIYPEGPQALTFARPQVRLGPDGLSATMDLRVFGAQYLEGADKSLAGKTLTITLVDGMRSAEARLTVAPATGPPPFDAGADGNGASLALILAFALLGGLILNLMPCVLPVLSIKLLSVVGHGGGERRLVRLSFLASAAGILFAFLVLAGVLIALKAGGMTIGWGIQFQQPWFLIAMTLMVTAFALNLWGVFEVRLPLWISDLGEHASHVHGLGKHFLQGAFATLLATPCSAPFLGTAVGFALARGWGEITAIFAMLGIGLALPYLGVAAFPGLATRLPKPGPWMVTFRRFLGLALIATGVWLLSVLATSAGTKVAILVAVLTAASAGLLALARLKRPGRGRRAAIGITAAVIAAFLAPGWLGNVTPGVTPGTGPGTASAKLNDSTDVLGKLWQPFDEARIPGLIAQGKTVFVDVTADWCITCQVNKALVLNRGEVLAKLQDRNVVIMQADWTRPDPVISDFLARHDRYGIPFNAVYGLGAPKGVVLPELLSQDIVLKAFKATARPSRVSSGATRNGDKQ